MIAICVMGACGGSDDIDEGKISISTEELTFSAEGGTKSLELSGASAENVTFSSKPEWIEAQALNKDSRSCYLRFTASATDSYDVRTANAG